jgi:hypothetical protein
VEIVHVVTLISLTHCINQSKKIEEKQNETHVYPNSSDYGDEPGTCSLRTTDSGSDQDRTGAGRGDPGGQGSPEGR